ncbi:hypothetical protein [Chitiniphilus eburneus]|uniref:Uncharacterized protein n=1 Tax=Chitiniphilus eburneus TaxID=2571148 RepID=A0A4U0PU91_9NEIS|nr:hypothetical protein [Chitiniphilus eburneus]TJZ72023.1 hypothetical protein FAZ21_12900 [Chitiniphilus eburneus]
MNANIFYAYSQDLSVENDVFNITWRPKEGGRVSGLGFIVKFHPADQSLIESIEQGFFAIQKTGGVEFWLVLQNSAWQNKSRIVMHYGLWKALSFRGFRFSGKSGSWECSKENEGKIKFFGAIKISIKDISYIAGAMIAEADSCILAVPLGADIKEILKNGWESRIISDEVVAGKIIKKGGVIINRVGEFDDKEKGVVVIGGEKAITEIYLSIKKPD